MSEIYNNADHTPGSIYRIALENFVTYKQVELFPGRSLNMILGPNGTGKSTFVCAIVLGLCGKTSVIGRAKKIAEYVRSGCEEATIELELYGLPGERNVIITRQFNLEGVTTWSIDHKAAREKQVLEVIHKFNIEVDNLCQLLPQDRVQDFAKMDPQQLLRSTLAAVGAPGSAAALDQLVAWRREQRGLGARIGSGSQSLQEQQRLNERLKVAIDAMQQRKEIEEKIELCEKKRLWLEYQEIYKQVVECRNDKKEAEKLVEMHKNNVEPLQKSMESARGEINKLEQEKLSANRKTHTLKDKVKESIESVKTIEYKMKEIDATLQEKLARNANRQREIEENRAKLDKLKTDKQALAEKVGDADKVKCELEELARRIKLTNTAIDKSGKERMEVQYDVDNNVVPQIRLYQNKVRHTNDVAARRERALRERSPDSYEALMWLRGNRHQFEGEVCEPMLLEMNVKQPHLAKYVEARIPARDLIAFTFTNSRDMNLFLRTVRTTLRLNRVNAVCSGADCRYAAPSVEPLSYLGFNMYLLDAITAPAPILHYLCRQYNVHRIPIGNEHTYNNSGKVPDHITYFFTENHKFVVRTSAYSGAKSSSVTELRPAQLLANTIDIVALEGFNKQIAIFEAREAAHRAHLAKLAATLAKLESNLNDLHTRRKAVSETVEKVRTISAQIRVQESKLRDIESEPALDLARERATAAARKADCAVKQCRVHGELCGVVKRLHAHVMNCEMVKVKLDMSRNAIVDQEAQLRELKEDLRNVQTTLERVTEQLAKATSSGKQKLSEAKNACGSKLLPQDPQFPYREQFDALPADLNELKEHTYELNTRIDCMDTGDEQIIREYEDREKLIKKLSNEVKNSSDMNKSLEDKMNELSGSWLPDVRRLLEDINARFGDMFARLGCAGEVRLERDGADEDYDKYGVAILVKFREHEPRLERLSRHTQSGGERALATALYLLAASAARRAFRVVDEINQGMDPINERKLFQLLVQVTTEQENCQYFLLTPKLLTNLEYNDRIMVHTIQNGQKIMNYKKWNYATFLERAHCYRP